VERLWAYCPRVLKKWKRGEARFILASPSFLFNSKKKRRNNDRLFINELQ